MPLDTDQQNALRNQIAQLCFDHIEADVLNTVSCYVACIGAAAICAAVLQPESRERLITETEGTLLAHANKRAAELRSGDFDRQLTAN